MARKKILVVDGDINQGEQLAHKFQEKDFQARSVPSGEEAVKILRDEWMDLIILAIKLQGEIDGFQLLKTIKKDEKLSEIPIVIESDKPGVKDVFKDIGAVDFFVKPCPASDLIKKVEEILS
ncbi:MAG: response regulator [Candidatus Omnitrophica bacterium]|nr:response regulator [Candidatus Omnitrophota bacterium]